MVEKVLTKKEFDMTSGNFFKKLFFFAIPIMGTGILQLLYNACDLIVCGQFGSNHSVAAISSTNSLINLIINLFLGLSIGANVIMARCYGRRDKESADRVVHTSMLFSLIIGVVIGIFGFFLSKTFLVWMGTPEEVINLSSEYLKIYFLGLPFLMIYNFGSSIMRATGDAKRPFYFLAFAGMFNVVLNLILVIVFKLDVKGVAIATVASECISSILIVISMMRNKGFYTLKLKNLRIHAKEAKLVAKLGIPAGLQNSIFSLSNVLIQSSINSLGSFVMDGNGAATSLEGFVYTAMNSVALACVAFVSANYGIGNFKNIKKVILYAVSIVFTVGMGSGLLMIVFGRFLLSAYIKFPESLDVGYMRLCIICSTYFLCGIMDTLAYSMRGLGYSLVPALVSLAGACGFRIMWIYTVFQNEFFHNLPWLATSYPISWALTSTVHLICLVIIYRLLATHHRGKESLLGEKMLFNE